MRIIQSLWTKPMFHSDKDINARWSGGWLSNKYHLMSWALSCCKFRQFYDKVSLVTDSNGYEIFAKELKLPYTRVDTELDNIHSLHPKLWSMGKIYTYSIQREAFIHADGDFFIFKKFPKHIEQGQLVAQSPECNVEYYTRALDQVYANFKTIPEEFDRLDVRALNAGIIGGHDFNFFRGFFRRASDLIDKNQDQLHKTDIGLLNIIVEQYYFFRLATIEKRDVNYLWQNVSIDFQECFNFSGVPHVAQYVHVIGEIKRNIIACQQVETMLRYEFPDVHRRVLEFCKSHKNINDSPDEAPTERFILGQLQNLRQWRNASSAYELNLQLSETTKLGDVKMGVHMNECECTYRCPYEKANKTITLYGTDCLLKHFENPGSIAQLMANLDQSSPASVDREMLLNLLAPHIFYYGTLTITLDKSTRYHNPDRSILFEN